MDSIPWQGQPFDNESISDYALRISKKIKHDNVVLLGVSFGGVLVQEISKHIKVRKLIIVSSVKSMHELPKKMLLAKTTKLYKFIPTQLASNIDVFAKYADTFKELGVNFNKTINDFSIGLGANVLYSQTEASKRSETNEFEYQNRQGLELSSIFGLQDLGFYSESDFTTNTEGDLVLNDGLPIPNFGAVQPGDIRYADQNDDNIIDQDDRIALGQSSSPWSYGINLNLKYKRFNLFVLGTGQTGALGNKQSGIFRNYYNPNGTDKYSEVVLGRWTPETANTATFPRLSSQENRNNFQTSSFWLYDNSFFRINRAQLTYEFNDALCDKLGVEDFSMNFQGTNLLEIAENKDVRQLNIGGNPQSRTYTFGVRISF